MWTGAGRFRGRVNPVGGHGRKSRARIYQWGVPS